MLRHNQNHESSELRPPEVASDVTGSGPGWPPPVTIEARVSGIVVTFCLFFGCGSTVEETRCLDRTGTGIVARGLPRPGSVLDGLPGVGSGPASVMRTGFRPSTGVVEVWSPSM
mgnify:CR=1 FL=1